MIVYVTSGKTTDQIFQIARIKRDINFFRSPV
jgi:hypothetical protein